MNKFLSLKGTHYPSGRSIAVLSRFRKARFLAAFTGLSMIYQIIFPDVCLALTSGPSSPEFSSFEPVATTNMVNEFTGQFVYNLPVIEIPGANGAGYALSLSYHSGDGPETESSWVGSGWTLNPGSINRNKRGIPDDFNGNSGDGVTYYNSAPKNWTVAATGNVGIEAYSGSVDAAGISAYTTVRYNNYKGFGFTDGFGLTALDGLFSLGMSVSDGNTTFSAAVNPGALLSLASNAVKSNNSDAGSQSSKGSNKIMNSGVGQSMRRSVQSFVGGGMNAATSSYISYLITDMSSPYNLTPYTGYNISGNLALTEDPAPLPAGLSEGVNISYASQKNIPVRTVPAFGYMYSGNDTDNNDSVNRESIMDYTVENSSTFNQRDKYLPIPFNTADAYFISGEGLGGAFRMYNDRVGIFSPNYVKSNTSIDFFGVDLHLGTDLGVGGEVVKDGSSSLEVRSSWSSWKNGNLQNFWFVPYDFHDSMHSVSENSFFRFNNDLGGKLVYDVSNNSDHPVAAVISGGQPNLDTSFNKLQPGGNIGKLPSSATNRRNGRASYIGFHTVAEINQMTSGAKVTRGIAYEKDVDINSLAGRNNSNSNSLLKDAIGEIATVNESGNQYVYGLPVYTAGETNMQHGISIGSTGDNYIVNSDISGNSIKVGEQYSKPYASNYLLTQITTPDYVDINQNGPDDADLGGYTKFKYTQAIGGADKSAYTGWYTWRSPYVGMYFRPNRLSDNTDDMGSYQYGYKEVYYLNRIETKTHYADFILDTTLDGMPANDPISAAKGIAGTNSSFAHKKLKQINLYAKDPNGGASHLIKTVHFEYNYDCWPGSPNSLAGNHGRLTLKRVWFEYNGVSDAYISPYVFDYKYPNVTYSPKYSYISDEMAALRNAGAETPDYVAGTSPGQYIDCWGNYQYDGKNRRINYQSWPSQAPVNFDPAAYQLKSITLPSGGQIHVQYEQNTYSYVQDRPACALVHITTTTQPDPNSFYVDIADDLGVTDAGKRDAMIDLINRTYKDQKIYFKFYYALMGGSAPAMGSCLGDYIEGYADFDNASYDPSYPGSIKIKIKGNTLPKDICYDYVRHQVGGKIMDGGSCTYKTSTAMTDPGEKGSLADALTALGTQLINATKAALNVKGSCCLAYNNQYSYFRIPVLNKKGGGIRVKRLLMYDKGVDVNSQSLYGTEYIYDNQNDGSSFGVATNEPAENKGENPLVSYLDKRTSQSWIDGIVAGKDKEQFEGPLGLNAIPGASIGYSRIVKKNIAQAKDIGTGYTVVDYYTAKDYPYDRYYATVGENGVSYTPIQTTKDDWSVDIGLFSYTINTGLRSSQGYCFIQNQMHGQLKSITNYPGIFDPGRFYDPRLTPIPVSQQTYNYFEPGEQIPMYNFDNYNIQYDQPGKEMDVTIDRRMVSEEASQTRLTGDITLGIAAIVDIPWVIGFPLTSGSDQKINTVVVNKVIHYPAIVRSITNTKDGYTQTTENLAFDPLTTKAVLTRSFDGYDGLYLKDKNGPHNGQYWTYNFPASSQYPEMGQRAWNERYTFYKKAAECLTVGSPIGTPLSWQVSDVNSTGMFGPGDLVALYKKSGGIDMVHVRSTSGNDITVWMAQLADANALTTGNTTYYKAEIIHSHYNNNLSASAGGFTQYGDSVTIYDGNPPSPQLPPPVDSMRLPSIIKANVTTYADNSTWSWLSTPLGFPSNYNYYEAGQKGIWRPNNSYVYRADTRPGSDPSAGNHAYTAGVTQFNLTGTTSSAPPYINVPIPWRIIMAPVPAPADWQKNPGTWIQTSQVDAYSPDGAAVQEHDVDGIFSMAKYGYHNMLPYMIAQNAPYGSILFESFENNYGSGVLEDGMTVTNANIVSKPHTGKNGYMLTSTVGITTPNRVDVSGKGMVFRFWALAEGINDTAYWNPNEPASIANNFAVSVSFNNWVSNQPTTIKYVATAGQWSLYEATVKPAAPGTPVAFKLLTGTGISYCYIDDVRVQPIEAKAMAYVYDVNTFKVIAEMDDQNFANIYQYNGEGKLVRKLVETMQGVKTIEETQYHTPKIRRN